MRIPLTIVLSRQVDEGRRFAEPVTFGVPFPKGILASGTTLRLVAGRESVPLQTRVLDHWSDGSIRWILIDARLNVHGLDPASCELTVDGAPVIERDAHALVIDESGGRVVVDTGRARFVCGLSAFPFESVATSYGETLDAGRSGLQVVRSDGARGRVRFTQVALDERGPLRSVVRWTGQVDGDDGQRWLDLKAEAHFFAQSPVVRLALTVRNPHRAVHPGNFWELGDGGSLLLQDVSLSLGLPAATGREITDIGCSIDRGARLNWAPADVDVYQESSGGAQWRSRAHVNREGEVPLQRRGYVLRTGQTLHAGDRATPVVVLRRGPLTLAATAEYFWENFPRSASADTNGLRLGLFSPKYPDPIELQGGEQKTHEWAVAFGDDEVSDIPLGWCRSPVVVHARPDWYCESGALGRIDPCSVSCPHETLIAQAVDGPDTFPAKRERIDEFGWRNFGDIYADHEAVFHEGPEPLVSHYNNQYDAIGGFAYQFFRTGDVRWWLQMRELAAHVVDIDLYHTTEDKAAYSQGLFWHTFHYVEAGRSTHRAYPQAPGVPGGGASNEHNYNAGLALHHFATGSAATRAAAVQLARWVVQADDGGQTVFRWLDRGPTGGASSTADVLYHGPGRGPGNSIVALLNGYRLTGDEALFSKAEELVCRCIHPDDDVAERDLLNAEKRWSYTVFLQALGCFLDECLERGRLGTSYAWARLALLRYARWMAAFEYPYLETPEKLEYPTETWAAQDIRKADVFTYAALHASDGERAVFRERADFFYRYATEYLASAPTRSLARPVVILLSNGLVVARYIRQPLETLPIPDAKADGERSRKLRPFVPQRTRAIRRAAALAAAGVIAMMGALVWWLLR
jgi:hypothetical protein